jgi:ribonucleotide reductase alpha subunit
MEQSNQTTQTVEIIVPDHIIYKGQYRYYKLNHRSINDKNIAYYQRNKEALLLKKKNRYHAMKAARVLVVSSSNSKGQG